MYVPHFLLLLRIAVNPDDVFSIWNPALSHFQHFSAPSFWSFVITSPLCLEESKLAKRSSKLCGFGLHGVIMIELSFVVIVTH